MNNVMIASSGFETRNDEMEMTENMEPFLLNHLSNSTNDFIWEFNTCPSHNLNGSLSEPLDNIRHGWVVISGVCINVITYPCLNPDVGLTDLRK